MELENIVANTVYLKAREGKEMDFCLTLLLVTQDLPLVPSFLPILQLCPIPLFSHLVLSKNGGSLPTCLKNKAFFFICWLVLNQYQHATTNTSHLHIQPNDIVIYLFVFFFSRWW
jgi:hypothetical protein